MRGDKYNALIVTLHASDERGNLLEIIIRVNPTEYASIGNVSCYCYGLPVFKDSLKDYPHSIICIYLI